MVECINEDAKLGLDHANGKTYSSFSHLQHKNHAIKRVKSEKNYAMCEFTMENIGSVYRTIEITLE